MCVPTQVWSTTSAVQTPYPDKLLNEFRIATFGKWPHWDYTSPDEMIAAARSRSADGKDCTARVETLGESCMTLGNRRYLRRTFVMIKHDYIGIDRGVAFTNILMEKDKCHLSSPVVMDYFFQDGLR